MRENGYDKENTINEEMGKISEQKVAMLNEGKWE